MTLPALVCYVIYPIFLGEADQPRQASSGVDFPFDLP